MTIQNILRAFIIILEKFSFFKPIKEEFVIGIKVLYNFFSAHWAFMKWILYSKKNGSLSLSFMLNFFELLTIWHQRSSQSTYPLSSDTSIEKWLSLERLDFVCTIVWTFYFLSTFFENILFFFKCANSQADQVF